MSELTLFDVASPPPSTAAPGERRRARQAGAVARGCHPLSVALRRHIPLHDDPARTCGTCWYRMVLGGEHAGRYPKCTAEDGRRITNGPGTDVRLTWPACRDHTYGEPGLSPDAARHVPEVAR